MSLVKNNGILEDVSGEIGYTATCALVAWFGGESLYIPMTEIENHPIRQVIGDKPFARLISAYGGENINLPIDYQRERARRNKLVGALIVKGVSNRQIARIACMSERQIVNIRTELEEAHVLPMILKDDAVLSAMDSNNTTIDDICIDGIEIARRDLLIMSLAMQNKDLRRRLADAERYMLFSSTCPSAQASLFEDEPS